MTTPTACSIEVQSSWIGKSITGDGGPVGELLQQMRRAQVVVLNLLEPALEPDTNFGIRWLIELDGEQWDWNPLTPIPPGTVSLVCVGELK